MQVNTPEVHQNERFLARPSRNPDVSKASRRALLSGTPGSTVEFPKKQENSSLDYGASFQSTRQRSSPTPETTNT